MDKFTIDSMLNEVDTPFQPPTPQEMDKQGQDVVRNSAKRANEPTPSKGVPSEEESKPKPAQDEETPPEKEYLGAKGSEAYFYINRVMTEDGQVEGIDILDAEDNFVTSAKELNIPVDDMKEIITQVAKKTEMTTLSFDVLQKYFLDTEDDEEGYPDESMDNDAEAVSKKQAKELGFNAKGGNPDQGVGPDKHTNQIRGGDYISTRESKEQKKVVEKDSLTISEMLTDENEDDETEATRSKKEREKQKVDGYKNAVKDQSGRGDAGAWTNPLNQTDVTKKTRESISLEDLVNEEAITESPVITKKRDTKYDITPTGLGKDAIKAGYMAALGPLGYALASTAAPDAYLAKLRKREEALRQKLLSNPYDMTTVTELKRVRKAIKATMNPKKSPVITDPELELPESKEVSDSEKRGAEIEKELDAIWDKIADFDGEEDSKDALNKLYNEANNLYLELKGLGIPQVNVEEANMGGSSCWKCRNTMPSKWDRIICPSCYRHEMKKDRKLEVPKFQGEDESIDDSNEAKKKWIPKWKGGKAGIEKSLPKGDRDEEDDTNKEKK